MPAAIPADQILEAVLDVIAEHGFAAATTARMAHAAGTSEMTLFRRFGDKAGLVRAALDLEAGRFLASGIGYTGNMDADLSRIVGSYEDLLQRRGRMVFAFFLEAPRVEELHAASAIPYGAISAVVRVISRYQAEGSLREGDPWTVTIDLLSPLILKALLTAAQPTIQFEQVSRSRVEGFKYGWASPRSS